MRKTSGVSLMLLIFLSLCLIVFSLLSLSLSGAVADETLSSQAADRTTEYYAAVTSANALLAQIDEQLAAYLREIDAENTSGNVEKTDTKSNSGNVEKTDTENNSDDVKKADTARQEAAYLQLCSQIGEDIPGVSLEDGALAFSVGIDDDQILQIRLDIPYPSSDDDPLYRIHTWRVVNTNDWNADNSMHLFRSKDKKEY